VEVAMSVSLRREEIGEDTPLRLDVAAKLYFPDGSMSGRSLQREAGRGNLEVMHIAGKTFTTLADIGRMCAKCRVRSGPPGSTCEKPDPAAAPSGSSRTAASNTALARARTISRKLKQRLPTTFEPDHAPASGKVIRLRS
jgi:hypothetical protein